MEYPPGARRCEFCGRLLAREEQPAAGGGALRTVGAALKTVAAIALVAGGFAWLGTRAEKRGPAGSQPAAVAPAKLLAAQACEEHIRGMVTAPFRVVALRSGLVAEEEGGQVVSGSVDLQSVAGELQRKRYWCRVRPDTGSGVLVEDGRLY